MSESTPMGPGREFDLIRSMLDIWGDLAMGIGSDAADLKLPDGERVIVSTDATVEGIHFRREWLSAREVGYRATASALSDLAAAAAEPRGVLVALNLPNDWRASLEELARGIADAVRRSGPHARIIGGDMSRSTEFSVTVTVVGSTSHPLTRSGAGTGDRIFLTGDVGRSGAALQKLLAGAQPSTLDRNRFVRPEPRTREAIWLARNGAKAAIDISDGLVSELFHLAAASRKALRIHVEHIPVIAGGDQRRALESGEEYELMVIMPASFDPAPFKREFGIELTSIGSVVADGAGVEILSRGTPIALPKGYSHF